MSAACRDKLGWQRNQPAWKIMENRDGAWFPVYGAMIKNQNIAKYRARSHFAFGESQSEAYQATTKGKA
jgi:hypothetical protein